jgi:hypothetical protein
MKAIDAPNGLMFVQRLHDIDSQCGISTKITAEFGLCSSDFYNVLPTGEFITVEDDDEVVMLDLTKTLGGFHCGVKF